MAIRNNISISHAKLNFNNLNSANLNSFNKRLSLFSGDAVGFQTANFSSFAQQQAFLPKPAVMGFQSFSSSSFSAFGGGGMHSSFAMGSMAWGNNFAAQLGPFAGGHNLMSQSFSAMGGFGFGGHCFGGLPQAFGSFGGAMGSINSMHGLIQGQLSMAPQFAHMSGMSASMVAPGRPASFPQSQGSAFLSTLTNSRQNARRLNVSGRHDVKVINQAIGKLKTASAKVSVSKPGDKTGPGKLALTAEQVSQIKGAKTTEEAKALVRKFICSGTKTKPGTGNMNDKRGIRNGANRNTLNKLLGTKVRSGREKNSGSSLVLDSICESVAKSVRGGNFGTTNVGSAYAMQAVGAGYCGAFGMSAMGASVAEVANGAKGLTVDLAEYTDAANKVGELYSPLIFDLEGTGLDLQGSSLIAIDLDGDGNEEMISDLDEEIGLLVFDSKFEDDDEEIQAAGRDMFGNGTDLSAYGITGPKEDGSFENGFDALRALCENLEVVRGDKQHLTTDDLKVLEEEVGLRMRVGGLIDGEDKRFSDVKVSQINLGNPDAIQDIEQAKEDRWGNRLMEQEGATFLVGGEERSYADIWFNIQARVADEPAKEFDAKTIMASRRIL